MKIEYLCDCGQNWHGYDNGMRMGYDMAMCLCDRVKKMDILELIEYIGHKYKLVIFLKYDGLRESNKWTILIDGQRICDTDNPRDALYQFLKGKWR